MATRDRIVVGWIGNWSGMNVQHVPASSRLTPAEWADLWRHPSSMSRAGHSVNTAVKSTQCRNSEAIQRRVLTAQLTVDKHREMVLAKPNSKHLPLYAVVTRKRGGSSDALRHHGRYKYVDYGARLLLNASHGEQVNSVFVMSVSATQQRNLYLGL